MSQSKRPLYISYAGPTLLETPLLNKGSAFSPEERVSFNLTGLIPPRYESIEEQVERAYMQYSSFGEAINKHIYLRAIQDSNETLFHRLVQAHLEEMMPIIYTPIVGEACERFSDIYRSNRGLFIGYSERHQIDDILRNATKQKVKVIVVTDGERILGLGDQGIGGMGIPIGKLSLYTACGGISPAYTLPVMLDVGTNNEKLLNDPMYMGSRHKRISQEEYDEFLELFISAVERRWPNVMLQFEDFAQPNAMPLLSRYRDRICCFNDDIQGTAAVTVGTILAACRHGLVMRNMKDLRDFQEKLAQGAENVDDWSYSGDAPSLLDVIHCAKPTVLIGVSGQSGLFTESVVKALHKGCQTPIVFPLSNPSRQVEATPQQVIEWTAGDVIIATGSPFDPVEYEGKTYPIAQCNNSYIFPGIGLGIIASKASRISDEMMMIASETLAKTSAESGSEHLLPPITEIAGLSKKIAFEVGKLAMKQGLALELSDELLNSQIEKNFWKPTYREYKRTSQ
jgi:malate dehydrogenase (oxaloacetate-decarboxylating)